MKINILTPFSWASFLLISACASSPQESGETQMPGAERSALVEHDYRCESGETIAAAYPTTDSATVQYQGGTYNMQIVISASGARYVGGGLVWWTKGSGSGSEGTLYRQMADGSTGAVIEACTES